MPYRTCDFTSYKPYVPACGSIFETEQDLMDAYNSVCEPEGILTNPESIKYLLFCPYCKNFFYGERPNYSRKRFYR